MREIPESLHSLYWAVKDALMAAEHARDACDKLNLPGTRMEIGSAVSHLRSVVYEIEEQKQREFLQYAAGSKV